MRNFNTYILGLIAGILFFAIQPEAYSRTLNEGAPPMEKSITMNLYPNPSNGEFRIEMNVKEKGKLTARLFDMTGKLIEDLSEQLSLDLGRVSGDIKLKDLSPGIYFLRVEIGGLTGSKKIMIR